MTFANSMPTFRTSLEQTVFEIVGFDVNVETIVAGAAVVAFTLFFKSTAISCGLR